MNQNKDPMRERIYLAALLHDIGKFYQRADAGSVSSSKELNDFVRNLESVFCPLRKDHGRSHKHVLWTAQFLEKFRPVFLQLNQNADWQDLGIRDSLLHLAASHHLSEDQLTDAGKIIRKADHLSSGMDRSTDEALKDDQDEKGWDAFKRIRMTSVTEGILSDKKDFSYHLPVEPMSLKRSYFPQKTFTGDPDYKSMWDQFETEFKFIQSSSLKAFSESFLYLLYKYGSTIPSSTVNFPDVSLYDHLKTTAAIAVCLHDWKKDGTQDSDPFMMIGGDFSGIQSYIYNIVSENAAKNLKGRSFYLKLLSDSVVSFLLKELDLFEANIIYNSGGGFYILAPNTESVRQKLAAAGKEIESKIFEAHGTALYVSIDSVTMSENALMGQKGESIGKCWENLFTLRDQKKKRRYSGRLLADYDYFFMPGETGGTEPRDSITGEELSGHDRKNARDASGNKVTDDNKEKLVSELTWKQIRLGRELKKARLWVISDGPLKYWPDRESINPANLGFHYYFLSEKDIAGKQEMLKASADKVKIITINGNDAGKCDFVNSAIQGAGNIYGFDFFGGNNYPTDEDGSPKSFDALTGKGEFKRLGILRMDVDNLGLVFQKGFDNKRSTFSRYSALSRSFDWFFKGYINTLWKENYSETTYIVYSGGDDLFLVGRWNDVIGFAELIRKEFREFVCQNPMLTLSGGMAVVTPKFPIKRGAEESEEAETQAKTYSVGDRGKNAFSLLGMPMGWENEYPLVKAQKDEILKGLSSGKLPKSFISKLYGHFGIDEDKPVRQLSPRVYWMLAYDFSRFEERARSNPELKDMLRMCKTDIFNKTFTGKALKSPYQSFELWLLAARWAELENRTFNQ